MEREILSFDMEINEVKRKTKPVSMGRRKKLFSSFIMLLVTIVALTTATYAWFTQTSIAELAGVDVNVEATSGIQISMDAVNWYTALTPSQIRGIAYSGSSNQVPERLRPISSGGTVTSGKMNMYFGTVETNDLQLPILTAIKTPVEASRPDNSAGTTGDFIAFDVFIKSTNDGTLRLGTDSAVLYKANSSIPNDADRGLKNSSRVAFIKEGFSENATSVLTTSIGNVTTAPATNGSVVFWEPNNNAHTQGGIAYATNIAKLTGITSTSVIESYHGVKAPILRTHDIQLDVGALAANSNYSTLFNQVFPQIKTPSPKVTAPINIFSINKGITKVRIYAWVEGQDVDCEDDASGADITFLIKFMLA